MVPEYSRNFISIVYKTTNPKDYLTANLIKKNKKMAFFDDLERQMMDMIRSFEYPSFGRIEPAESGPSPSRDATNRRQYPFMRARMDLVESPSAYRVIIELPGVKKEEI